MDASAVTAAVKALNEANAAGKTEDVTRILAKLQAEVTPTEEILKTSKAGIAVGKLRGHTAPGVSSLAREIVKAWKDVIEENKKKRKRDDGDAAAAAGPSVKQEKEEGGKKIKAEATTSAADPQADSKPDVKDVKDAKDVKDVKDIEPDTKPKVEEITDQTDEKPAKSPSPPRRPPLSTIDSSRKKARTAKEDGIAETLAADAGVSDTVRNKCVVLIYDSLAGDSTAEKRILSERAIGIERAVFKQFDTTSNDYRAKIRSLMLNLKDKGNPGLRNEIVLGYISADKLANMSKDEMASESVRAMKEKIASDNLFKAKAVGETQAETDAFKCGRCHQRKCTYYQMQTRSADEPMTTFVTTVCSAHRCTNCNNRWKFS